jgi:hypothetical protein
VRTAALAARQSRAQDGLRDHNQGAKVKRTLPSRVRAFDRRDGHTLAPLPQRFETLERAYESGLGSRKTGLLLHQPLELALNRKGVLAIAIGERQASGAIDCCDLRIVHSGLLGLLRMLCCVLARAVAENQ